MLGPIYSEADFLDYPQYLNTGYIRNYLKEQKISTDRPSIDVSRATITGAVYSAGYALDPEMLPQGISLSMSVISPSSMLLRHRSSSLNVCTTSVAVTYPEEAPSGILVSVGFYA